MNLILQTTNYIVSNLDKFLQALSVHCLLSLISLFIGIIISIPIGILCSKDNKIAEAFINILSSMKVIPSIAILSLLMPFIGTGFKPSLFALTIIACPPILINTALAIKKADKSIIEAALGMGMNQQQILLKIKLPLAQPLIFAGIKVSAVDVIASATLAAFIGGGGLGSFIINGLSMYDFSLLLVGALSVAFLAVFTQLGLTLLEKILDKQQEN